MDDLQKQFAVDELLKEIEFLKRRIDSPKIRYIELKNPDYPHCTSINLILQRAEKSDIIFARSNILDKSMQDPDFMRALLAEAIKKIALEYFYETILNENYQGLVLLRARLLYDESSC